MLVLIIHSCLEFIVPHILTMTRSQAFKILNLLSQIHWGFTHFLPLISLLFLLGGEGELSQAGVLCGFLVCIKVYSVN